MINHKSYDRIFRIALAISISFHLSILYFLPDSLFKLDVMTGTSRNLALDRFIKLALRQALYYSGKSKSREIEIIQFYEIDETKTTVSQVKEGKAAKRFEKTPPIIADIPKNKRPIPTSTDSLARLLLYSPLMITENGNLTLKAWQAVNEYFSREPTVLDALLQELAKPKEVRDQSMIDKILQYVPIPLAPYESTEARHEREAWEQIQQHELQRERDEQHKNQNASEKN